MPKNNTQSAAALAADAAYNAVPYLSYPFVQTNPLTLQGIGKLFGLNAPAPDKARILEIGCAAGGNIMGIAAAYPESRCVGIDYAARQIEEGLKDKAAAGLSNLELKHLSIMDIGKDFGEFDYIIAHGVMSWVPVDVQEKILDICKNNLSKEGIAFISFNTLPGWNTLRSLRDMMLYHTARYDDPATKAQQSRLLLKFVGDAMREHQNPMADLLKRELEILDSSPDYYLLHDHLEEINTPFYFHEFAARAAAHDLQYLADTNLEKMFSSNLSASVAQMLATSDDLIRTEQYMDFIYDRRFRNTLLCHKDRILNRNLQPSLLGGGVLVNRFDFPQGFKDYDLASGAPLNFTTTNGIALTATNPAIIAMIRAFLDCPAQGIAVNELAARVRKQLAQAKVTLTPEEDKLLEDVLLTHALRYLFIGGFLFLPKDFPVQPSVSEKPKLTALTRHQSQHQDWITSPRLEFIRITVFDKAFMRYVDGTCNEAALVKAITEHFESGELKINEGDKVLTGAERDKKIPTIVKEMLNRYANCALLVK